MKSLQNLIISTMRVYFNSLLNTTKDKSQTFPRVLHIRARKINTKRKKRNNLMSSILAKKH